MKAYLFIETGEIRPVKQEEWYLSDSTIRRAFNNNITIKDVILSRHVIDIPDGKTTFVAFPSDAPMGTFIPGTAVPIPRPKKKVKKWRWVFADDYGLHISSTEYSLEAWKRYDGDFEWSHSIPQTEIEAEE